MKKTLKINKKVETEVELPFYCYEEYTCFGDTKLSEAYVKFDSDDNNNYYQTSIYFTNKELTEFSFEVIDSSRLNDLFDDVIQITKEEFDEQLDKLNELVKNLNKDKNVE